MHSNCFSSSTDHEKSILRREKLAAIREYRDKKEYSDRLVLWLESNPMFISASTILAFSPMGSEPDISPILEDERILLPYIDGNVIRFAYKSRMARSSLGFLEPEERKEADYSHAVMLVPLVAFDSTGNRLGRGGGFYDRYIRENRKRIHTIGIGYPVSLSDHIPVTELDEPLDEIPLL
mgnify:CR=1 FL=1